MPLSTKRGEPQTIKSDTINDTRHIESPGESSADQLRTYIWKTTGLLYPNSTTDLRG